ncbi:MAG: serine acetyltransferase [Pedobacter sp.]|nr:MAG: serine acetyltransferase [Pedobacter sp.]
MNEDFYRQLYHKQGLIEAVPSNQEISEWAMNLLNLLYPERLTTPDYSVNEIKRLFIKLETELERILNSTKVCEDRDNKNIVSNFFNLLPELYRKMNTDILAIVEGDPAAESEFEVIRSYPGFLAIAIYRIAHELMNLNIPIIPRILTEYAHSVTGIDIHPAAQIGEHLFIDHGTGIVIGETTVIGNHVKLYQGVTLGALSVDKNQASLKRHPTIEDHVIIYSGATILGGETTIGKNCVIGGNVWLTKSVSANSTVYHQSTIKVVETKNII